MSTSQFVAKLKPAGGFAQVFHISLIALMPIVVFVLVRIQFFQLALAIILLSKWRMLAVKPRYWPVNIRANGIDIIVGLSLLVFMIHTSSSLWQLVWVLSYELWLIVIKPSAGTLMVGAQALIGQLVGLIALFMEWPAVPSYGLVAAVGIICFLAARHFFDGFEESYGKLLSYTWAYFAAALAWLLAHWLLFYGIVAQLAVFLTIIGYGLAVLYYLDHTDKLSRLIRKELLIVMIAVVAIMIIFANWGNKII